MSTVINTKIQTKSSLGLPLHLLEKSSGEVNHTDEAIRRLAHENMILRRKVVELTQAVITLQRKTKDMQNFIENRKDNLVQAEDSGIINSRVRNETHLQDKNAIKNAAIPSELVTLWTSDLQSLSDKERNRILLSKRREYLTWRNKAQSWLSKMVKASDKLLGAEASFTRQEYLEQLLLFHTKISQQGDIIETAREAGLIYLIICDTSTTEKEIIQYNIQSLKSDYENILVRIVERIDTLRMMTMAIAIPPQELAMNVQDECRDYLKDNDSYNNFCRMTLLMTNDSQRPRIKTGNVTVATDPKSYNTDSYVMLSLVDENDPSRRPIFV